MTQVSVRSDQETSTRVSPAPVWWISASFLAVTVWGREEQLVRPDTRYISGKHPLSDNSELLELVKLHTNKQGQTGREREWDVLPRFTLSSRSDILCNTMVAELEESELVMM